LYRLPRLLTLGLLALQGCLWSSLPLRGQATNPAAFASDPAGGAAESGPIYVFEGGPLDLESIRKRLARPDVVLLRGAEYDRLRRAAEVTTAPVPPAAVVESIRIGGAVRDGVAQLAIDAVVVLSRAGPTWVPVRLDGQILTGALEEPGRDVPVRAGPSGGWEVRLEGAGRHRLTLELVVAVRSDPAGDRLELAIPDVASTRIDLGVPGQVGEAESAPGQPIEAVPSEEGRTSRLRGSLTARDRIALRWRTTRERGAGDTPLLSAQGEIALQVNRGMLQTRSTWSVQCERGTARTITFQFADPGDKPMAAELEDQPVPITESGAGKVVVALPTPMRPGERRRLALTSRRELPAGVTTRFTFRGFPVVAAASQSGMIGIVQGPDLWVSGTAGRGLRQVDPRELTDALRSRPSTVLAYHFVDQPFELELRVDPSPPIAVVDARTSVRIEAGRARVESDLSYRVERGRFQEVQIGLPQGSELGDVGPRPVVESYQVLDQAGPTGGGTRPVASLRLSPSEVADGQFRVHLAYSEPIATAGEVGVRLPRPLNVLLRGGHVAVFSGRDLTVELAPDAAGTFTPLEPEPIIPDAELVPGTAPAAAPDLWLSYNSGPDRLPLRLTPRSRVLRHESRVRARVDRTGVEIRQTIDVGVRNGSLRSLELAIPPALEGNWELDPRPAESRSARVVALDRVSDSARDEIRYRLVLDREVTDRLLLAIRTRLRPESWGAADQARRLELHWVRPVEGFAAPVRVEVEADPSMAVEPVGPGWIDPSDEEASSSNDGPDGSFRLVWNGPDSPAGPPPVVRVTAGRRVRVPDAVVARLWLRTTESPGGDLRYTVAFPFRAGRDGLSFALPAGAALTLVRAGAAEVGADLLPGGRGYHIALPESTAGPVLVEIEYAVPASSTSSWAPPRLLDGVSVQQTLWDVRLGWSRAVLGVPPGWTDANRWYWDWYIWKRRPVLDERELASWVRGPGSTASPDAAAESLDDSAFHRYLFSRVGEPAPLRLTIWPRWALVAACSGLVLAAGMLAILLRPDARWVWAGALVLALLAAVALEPNTGFQLAQSALIGVLLVLVAGVTQRYVERRHGTTAARGEPSGQLRAPAPAGAGSAPPVPIDVGSDDSTVIRRREPGLEVTMPVADSTADRLRG
jgi:hypothetical protein